MNKNHNFRTIFKKSSGRYIKVPRKSGASYFLTIVLLFTFLAAFVYGVMTVDENTSEVGWNRQKTELAFSSSSTRYEITVMDHTIELNAVPLKKAADIYTKTDSVIDFIKPPPLRLADMLIALAKDKLGWS